MSSFPLEHVWLDEIDDKCVSTGSFFVQCNITNFVSFHFKPKFVRNILRIWDLTNEYKGAQFEGLQVLYGD